MNIRDQHSKHVAIEPIQVESEMAEKIGMSPTYLSKVERGEFPPPAEDKVRKIAVIIGAGCGRVAGEVASVPMRSAAAKTVFMKPYRKPVGLGSQVRTAITEYCRGRAAARSHVHRPVISVC
jgi:hypothetical protein